MYGIHADAVSPKTSIVIVTQKNYFLEQLRKLTVICQSDKKSIIENFCSAVPVITQSSPSNEIRVSSGRDNRPPMIRIVSTLSSVINIVNNNKNIDTIIVDGESKILTHQWKYITNFNDIEELYDIENDFREQNELSQQKPKVCQEFRNILEDHLTMNERYLEKL